MTSQTMLYFTSILLAGALTGFLAFYAWRQPALPGVRAYAWLALSECLLAVADILSMLSGTQAQALFWFKLRFFFTAAIPVIWLAFALAYSGQKGWFSTKLWVGALAIPTITQVMLWSNDLHGLWAKQEMEFHQNGPLWIAEIGGRIPGLWFMVHSFYSLILLLAGMIVILLAAWRKGRLYRGQALLLSGGALVALTTTLIPLFNLLPQAEFNPFIPGIGASALLYALAILRFQFLKRPPTQEGAAQLTNLEAEEKRSLAVFSFIFILFATGIAAASYLTYQDYEEYLRAQVESQLAAVSSLKVSELQDWRNGSLEDASLFYQNDNFSELVRRYLDIPADADAQNRLAIWLKKIRANPEYSRVFLLDTEGRERISSPTGPELPADYLVDQVAPTLASGQIAVLDFHRDTADDLIHLAILIPIFDQQNGAPLGVLVLRIDPEVTLFPFIQRWPVPSPSAETLLVRREGEAALFLNPLRFQSDTALNLRIPLERTDIPSVKAVLGQEGIVEGMDYRGIPVIAEVRAVPDSPWFLVAKLDSAEVYAPLRERLWGTILLFGVLVAGGGAGLALVWRQQRLRYYRGQVEATQALRASEEKFRLAFLTSPDSITITRFADGKFISVNKGFEQISGYTQEETIGKTSLEINIWKDPEDRRKIDEELRSKGEIRNYEAPFLTRNGEITGLMSAALLELDGVPHILSIIRDITERKQAEEQLMASEARYRRLFEAAKDGILILDADTGVIVDANPFLLEMIGSTREEICGKKLWELGFLGDITANEANFLELQQNEYIRYEDLPLETWDGRHDVEFVSNVYLVAHQKVIQCNIRDITARKRAEEELRQSEAQYRGLFEHMLNGFAYCKMLYENDRPHDFVYIQVNEAFEKLTGLEDIKGKNVSQIIPGLRQSNPELFEIYGRVASTGNPEEFETFVPQLNSGIWFSVAVYSPEKDYFVALFNAITERKEAEQALEKYSAGLEAEVEQRTRELRAAHEKIIQQERLAMLGQLAGSVGHELRNPLGVISNAIYFLSQVQPDADAKVKEYLDIIKNEIRTADKIIADLLDFSRIKPMEQELVAIAGLVRQVLERFPAPTGVAVTLDLPENMPQVYAVPHQLVQVLGNLAANAYQAMPEGGSLVISNQLSVINEQEFVTVSVRDTGMGISPEDMEKLFEPLFTTKSRGIGLGLAVCKKLAEANQGWIDVQSVLGEGSTFTVYLPAYKPGE